MRFSNESQPRSRDLSWQRRTGLRTEEPPLIPVAIGELVDKITILEIKAARITDATKLLSIRCELGLLRAVWEKRRVADPSLDALIASLKNINEILWTVEA